MTQSGPVTHTDTTPHLSSGRSTSMTFVTPMREIGKLWLSMFRRAARHLPPVADFLVRPLVELSVIHFARWSVVETLPSPIDGSSPRRLTHPYLLFESHSDTDTSAYVDNFIEITPNRMRLVWASSFGYPGVIPSAEFTSWTEANELNDGYYWCAYPDGSVSTIRAALALEERFGTFRQRAAGMTAAEFDRAWDLFLTEVQAWL
jgi:hypothetical protein